MSKKTLKVESDKLEQVARERVDDPSVQKIVIDSSFKGEKKEESTGWFNWISNWRWKPTSLKELEDTEREMLQSAEIPFEQSLVKIEVPNSDKSVFVNTLKAGQGPPILFLHGFAAGIGLWAGNLKEISKNNTIYAIDLVGFGRSTRYPFNGKSKEEAEDYFLDMIENWRNSSGIDGKFNLLGHSFGGYLAGNYALRYPQNINHLVLVDPWGVPHRPEDAEKNYTLKWKIVKSIITSFSPLAAVRVAGPWGPGLVSRFRSDLSDKFWHLHNSDVVTKYIYHINAQEPHGENAFALLSSGLAWASNPLQDRLIHLDKKVGLTMIYGEDTWMDRKAGYSVAKQLGSRASFHTIPDAGHHCYIDNWEYFNTLLSKELEKANSNNKTKR
eukprot:TRINITY_DN354_c0_g1_i1.p1 TRINITY_DN354_c0_g1~~TRINITY_DN354_c0_g1_i1.p1  ORF type:complete len:385 (-),score=146.94 TRINITY_DN354_c0_g1_i1:128-1282(-)